MSTMIQLRNVPDPLHRTLKIRAAEAGQSLSDYLIRELSTIAARPTLDELRGRLATRKPIQPDEPPAEAVRRERDG